jgi:hypothetical protein
MDEVVDYSSEEDDIPMLDKRKETVAIVEVEDVVEEKEKEEVQPVLPEEKEPVKETKELDESAFLRLSDRDQKAYLIEIERDCRLLQARLLHKVLL